MQLEPREYFTIARGLEDHTDSTTYYVRAVIRNARTDALIETVNLTDNGNRRFTYPWQVPADPSGLGFYILVTTTVYEDSGYTTKSSLYGEKFEEHLVQTRPNPNVSFGGPGGADVSYKKIREIVKDELGKLELPTPEKPQQIDLEPVSDALQAILTEVRGIDIPKAEKPDLGPVLKAIEGLRGAIEAIQIPETDLTPVLAAIAELQSTLDTASLDKTSEAATGILERIKQFYGMDIEEVKAAIAKLEEQLSGIAYFALQPGKKTINPNDE